MAIDTELQNLLHDTAETITPPPGDPGRVIGRARQRRRRRNAGTTLAAVSMVAFGAVGVTQLGDRSTAINVGGPTTSESPAEPAATADDGLPPDAGPTPEWSPIAPLPDFDPTTLEWSGTQFVMLGLVNDRHVLVTSFDGRTWSSQPLPTNMQAQRIAADGDTIVVYGPDGPPDQHGQLADTRVARTTNGGIDWQDLGLIRAQNSSATGSSPFVNAFGGVMDIEVIDRTLVAQVVDQLEIDVVAISEANNIDVPDPSRFSTDDQGITICTNEDCTTTASFAWQDLGLNPDVLFSSSDGRDVMASIDGRAFAPTTLDSEGWTIDSIAVVGDHFVLAASFDDGTGTYRSSDGLTWELVASDPQRRGMYRTTGTTLLASHFGTGQLDASDDFGATWRSYPDTMGGFDRVSSGPGGIVIVGALPTDDDGDEAPATYLAWSTDGGEGWGWQNVTQALGVDARPIVVVGDGVMLAAVVQPLEGDAGGQIGANARWFIAAT